MRLRYLLASALSNPYREAIANPRRAARIATMPPPPVRYAVFFTPRSGSSRLSDILSKAGGLGKPGEWFNSDIMRGTTKSMNAPDLGSYLDVLTRLRGQDGVFGFEITYVQMLRVFRFEARFLDQFRDAAPFWLIREDIVAQAVSISRMVQTKVAHAATTDPDVLAAAEEVFRYDPIEIRRRLRVLTWMEDRTDALIARMAAAPLLLSYERLLPLPPDQIANLFRRHLELPERQEPIAQASRHRKLGTDKNVAYAHRFRTEHPRLVARIDARRAGRLAALKLQWSS